MPEPTRRSVLSAAAALPAAAVIARPILASHRDAVAADLARYVAFGNKQAGGAGDIACGDWLADELVRAGYTVQRQTFAAPFFTPEVCDLRCDDAVATVWPQPIVVTTGAAGVSGPLVRIDGAGRAAGPLRGAIALLDLPTARWSTATAKPIREPIAAAFAAGAVGVAVITNGPTQKIIALNGDGRKPMFTGPVALLAPDTAGPFLAGAISNAHATLRVQGAGGQRPAFNFVGRVDRGRPRWLAVSTPRSGWFTCAGERGPGVAAWLWLARWAARAVTEYNLAFVCNSGHEYEYLGAEESLAAIAPPPDRTHFWLHLGAAMAARDWQEWPGAWRPLSNADSQRYLAITPDRLSLAQSAMRGEIGFEAAFSAEEMAAGELSEILRAGYRSAAGSFGIHRFHHVAEDDARCVSADTVAQTAAAFQRLIERVV